MGDAEDVDFHLGFLGQAGVGSRRGDRRYWRKLAPVKSDLVSGPVSLPELEFPSPLEVERGRREVDRSELSAFYLAVDHSVGDTLDGDQVLALGRKLRK